MRLAILTILMMVPQLLLAKVTLSGSGSVPRDTEAGYIDLDISIKSVTTVLAAGESKYAHRLTVYFKNDSSSPIAFDDKPLQDFLDGFSITYRATEQVVDQNDNKKDVTLALRIKGKASELMDLLEAEANKSITLTIEYQDSANTDSDDPIEIAATRDSGVAKTSPKLNGVSGIFKGIKVTTDSPSKISFTDGKSKSPSGLNLITAPADSGTYELKALVHDPDATSDTEEVTCTFDTSAAQGTACVTCPEGEQVYIKTGSLPAKVQFASTAKTGEVSVSNLTTDSSYVGFAAFRPDGVGRSVCFRASPSENSTFSELVDGKESKRGDPRCFIATAAYGSPFAKKVSIFRNFRDRVLLRSSLGRSFVNYYYRFSPPAAAWLSRHPKTATVVRWILDPLADLLEIVS